MFELQHGADLTRLQRAVWVAARALVVVITKLYFRAEVHGQENLPKNGAFIVSPVHRSNLDTPLLPVIRQAPLRFMGKDSLWNVGKIAAWVLTTLGGFPVERGAADRNALRAAEDVLARGETLVMFPEGTRRSGPVVKEENMFDGPSFLSGRQQVPIVPVGIGGSEAAMPIGRKIILPKKLVFVIGEPIAPPEPGPGGRVPRRVVKEHTEIVMHRVQEVFDEAMDLVGTPNPPRVEADSAEES
jgi:1-acyl-sn-glycerol-3-phosphate acyltransferase